MIWTSLLEFWIQSGVLLFNVISGGYETDSRPQNIAATPVIVNIDKTGILSVTSDKYLSLGLPPIEMKDHYKTFNISSVRANTLLHGLAPAMLRVGGTEADLLTFQPSTSSGEYDESIQSWPTHLSHNGKCTVSAEELALYENADLICRLKQNFTITESDWDTVNEFAFNNGLELIFGFSALKRKSDGSWDPHNALQLLDYTTTKKYKGNIHFELGNEPNSYIHKFNFTLSAHNHAKDFTALYEILRRQAPYDTDFRDSLIIGPDITQPNKQRTLDYVTQFLKKAGKAVNKITWHHYYLSAKSTSTSVANFTDPALLDSLQKELSAIKSTVNAAGYNNTRLWMGETDTASGGGVNGVSNRFVAGFMWLDKLGMAAQNGMELVIRQTFYSGHYALVDKNMQPLPDYWLSWVYKQLVGVRVINVKSSDQTRKTRMYGHCSTSRFMAGGITLYGMNLNSKAVTLMLPAHLQRCDKELYLMTPHGNKGLEAKLVNMNGKKMAMVNDKTLPQLKPAIIPANTNITLPGLSYAFIVIQTASYHMCK